MSYTQIEETEIVRDAGLLTAMIQSEEQKLSETKRKKCPFSKPIEPKVPIPEKPKKTVLQVPQAQIVMPPEPISDYKFPYKRGFIIIGIVFAVAVILTVINTGVGMFLLGLFPIAIPAFVIYGLVKTRSEKKKHVEAIKQTPAYLEQVEFAKSQAQQQQVSINAEYEKKQAEKDAEFEAAMKYYEEETYPAYQKKAEETKQNYLKELEQTNKNISRWESEKTSFINWLENDLIKNRQTLETLYLTTRFIPPAYRDLSILEWLYINMSETDMSYDRAVDLLDRERQRDVTLLAGQQVTNSIQEMNETMMSGFDYVYDAICAGNEQLNSMEDVLLSMDDTLRKTRRDMDIGLSANLYQRYKYRKEDQEAKKK